MIPLEACSLGESRGLTCFNRFKIIIQKCPKLIVDGPSTRAFACLGQKDLRPVDLGLSGLQDRLLYYNKRFLDSEWDKLAQNPHLAFYQIGPWLCPKYSIHQSLEHSSALRRLLFCFSESYDYSCLLQMSKLQICIVERQSRTLIVLVFPQSCLVILRSKGFSTSQIV